jgi:iron complex transport system substrate-binding protein
MRIVTLLPAATEIVAALGGAGSLVGISHECDFPASVLGLPRVTATPIGVGLSGAAIDAEVRRLHGSGKPVIGVDAAALRRLVPDVIVTQDLCEVCAVAEGEVYRLAAVMDRPPGVLTLSGRTVPGIWSDIRTVARALGLETEGDRLIAGLQSRLEHLQVGWPAARPRILCVEWLEPLYLAGHWVPELVEYAGGTDVGAIAGSHSARREWADVSALGPDILVVMLCGLGVERALVELAAVRDPAARSLLDSTPTWVIDGNAYTSRSGPRIVEGAELMAAAFHGRESPDMVRWQPLPLSQTSHHINP